MFSVFLCFVEAHMRDFVHVLLIHVLTFCLQFRHMDRSLTNEEVNEIQQKVRDQLESKLKVTLR